MNTDTVYTFSCLIVFFELLFVHQRQGQTMKKTMITLCLFMLSGAVSAETRKPPKEQLLLCQQGACAYVRYFAVGKNPDAEDGTPSRSLTYQNGISELEGPIQWEPVKKINMQCDHDYPTYDVAGPDELTFKSLDEKDIAQAAKGQFKMYQYACKGVYFRGINTTNGKLK